MPKKEMEWKMELFGMGETITVHIKDKDKRPVPNWFWRLMQYLFFGNKWYRTEV